MKINGEGVHDGDFRFEAAEHMGEGLAEGLGVGQPGIPGVEVTADGELLPVFEFLPDEVGGNRGVTPAIRAASFNKWRWRTRSVSRMPSLPPDVEIAAGSDAFIGRPATQESAQVLVQARFHNQEMQKIAWDTI